VSAVDTVLSALRAAGKRPRKAGEGWRSCCPAHDDRSPSLSVSTGADGRALVKCHAGCTVEAVCGALGLRQSDLFERSEHLSPTRRPKRQVASVPTVTGTDTPETVAETPGNGASTRRDGPSFASAEAALEAYERKHGVTSAHWHYHDADAEVVGLVARWDTEVDGKREKRILPASRGEDGKWRLTGMQGPRPLYALRELLAAPKESMVFVVEGEKAADATRSLGAVATTSAHGSKSADKTDWSPLAGREVVILPDHDEAGEQYAERVAELAKNAGAKSVLIVRLSALWPEMPRGGDMADFLAHHGGDTDEVRQALDRAIEEQASATEEVAPEHQDLPRWKPFPYEILPEIPRNYIIRTARALGCDPAFVGMGVLAALGAAIGNSRRIQLKQSWSEPAVLWTVCVGDSGTGKTPGFLAATEPLVKVQATAIKAYMKEMAKWKQENTKHEVVENRWKRRASRQKEDSEPEVPPDAPPMPVMKRFIVDDITIEALAVVLNDNPRGVIGVRDELNGWFASFDRHAKNGQSGADTSKWLSCFNAVSMLVDRKTSIPPVVYVPRAAVSLTGGIQPAILKRALRKEHLESGMAARLLFAYPPKRAKRWTEEDVPREVFIAYQSLLRDLYAVPMEPDPFAEEEDAPPQPRMLTLSPEAKALWITFYNEHAAEAATLSGDLAAAWAKLEAYTARLALVMHMVRWISGDPTVKDPDVVDEVSMAIGIQLTRWFGHEARRIYGMLGESEHERLGRELLDWIERHGGMATVRDVTHGIRAYRSNPDKAQEDLDKLVTDGYLVGAHVAPSRKGGRPRFEYRLKSVTETPALAHQPGGSGSGDTGDAARHDNKPAEDWGSL
jgi:hypothetical protein